MRICEQPEYNRPYEKFERYGAQALTDVELLAILIRVGTQDRSVLELAEELLCYNHTMPNLLALYEVSLVSLCQIKGIGKVKAIQIMALVELSKRLARTPSLPKMAMTSPQIVADYYMPDLRHAKEEYFFVILLNIKNKLISSEIISKGSLSCTTVHPREAYKVAISKSAHSIIALHNHPSGDPTPSQSDILLTKRLYEVGELIGIPLMDHIIIGDGCFKSLKEESCL
jgi:DNA repair protein RadC